ncbi:hypothetical protein [Streptomyces sp. CAS3]
MNAVHSLVLAGELGDAGNSWIDMFANWGTKGLKGGLICLVVIIMVQRFSLKAAIGALLLMVIALGLYDSRNDLADMFADEVKHPSKGAPAVPGIVRSELPSSADHSPGVGGRL